MSRLSASVSSHILRLLQLLDPILATAMGNLCGKQSRDGFDGPGRTLGSAPAPATKASVPAGANANAPKRTVGGPPRTLGESNAANDPRSAAAAAAEVRRKSKKVEVERRTALTRAYI